MDKIESIRVNVYGLPPRGLTKTALVPIPILGAAGSLGNRTMREGITAVFMLSALAAATSGAALGAAGALVTVPSGTDLENVKKKFVRYENKKTKKEFYADNGITFEAHDGEIIGILGPNGAGKTTLLRMIAGILEPTEGSIRFDNLNYKNNELEIKQNIAYLSGNTKLYDTLSAYELLKMCSDIYGVDKEEEEKRINEISKVLKMENFLYNKIGHLSTGQTQKVNIARCLIHNPKYYILDEATTGLDIISSQIILDFMKQEKAKGKTNISSGRF